jgi:preprotein translocase subunit YajC
MPSRKLTKSIAIGSAVLAIGGGAYGIVSATASTGSSAASAAASAPSGASRQPLARGGGSNARSGPAAGGSAGKVTGVSKSSFTVLTSAGQKVTVDEASATRYQKGTSTSSASAVTKSVSVLVLGRTDGTTITASKVVVQPTDGGGSTTSLAAGVVPFQRGARSTSKQVGQIPASYSQGSGTIVSGTAAYKATEAALAAYPGGVVDRVVKLSNGEYEVHNIGVNWPHHVFVSKGFDVVGAD